MLRIIQLWVNNGFYLVSLQLWLVLEIFCKPLRSNFFQTGLHKKLIWWIQVTCCLAGNPVIKHMPTELHLNSIWLCLYSNKRTGMRTQHYNKMPPSATICFSVLSFRAISCRVSTDSLWRTSILLDEGTPHIHTRTTPFALYPPKSIIIIFKIKGNQVVQGSVTLRRPQGRTREQIMLL